MFDRACWKSQYFFFHYSGGGQHTQQGFLWLCMQKEFCSTRLVPSCCWDSTASLKQAPLDTFEQTVKLHSPPPTMEGRLVFKTRFRSRLKFIIGAIVFPSFVLRWCHPGTQSLFSPLPRYFLTADVRKCLTHISTAKCEFIVSENKSIGMGTSSWMW